MLSLLERCGLKPASDYVDSFPHSLSGGQQQQVAIARALAPEPDILLADEPTSMLDVSIRTDVLRLLKQLRDEQCLAQILITHDLAAARFVADRIMVLYAGQLMELAPADALVNDPLHPYARLLMAAVPRPGGSLFGALPAGPGRPQTIDPPACCPFVDRCPEAMAQCRAEPAPVVDLGGRLVRCHLYSASP